MAMDLAPNGLCCAPTGGYYIILFSGTVRSGEAAQRFVSFTDPLLSLAIRILSFEFARVNSSTTRPATATQLGPAPHSFVTFGSDSNSERTNHQPRSNKRLACQLWRSKSSKVSLAPRLSLGFKVVSERPEWTRFMRLLSPSLPDRAIRFG